MDCDRGSSTIDRATTILDVHSTDNGGVLRLSCSVADVVVGFSARCLSNADYSLSSSSISANATCVGTGTMEGLVVTARAKQVFSKEGFFTPSCLSLCVRNFILSCFSLDVNCNI